MADSDGGSGWLWPLAIVAAASIAAFAYIRHPPQFVTRVVEPPARATLVEEDPRAVAKQLDAEADNLVRDTIRDRRDSLRAEFEQIDRDLKEGILQLQKDAQNRRREAADRLGKK